MKKQVAQLVVIATAAAFSLAAQGPDRLDHNGVPGGTAQNSADAIARRVEFLTALLTLTSAQASQATTIFTTAAAAVTPLQTNLSTARMSLRAAVVANNTAQIDQLSTQVGTFTGQITAAQNRAEAAFYALLTPEQRTRYDAVGNRTGGGRGR
jgi:Spy/CpxP family protein refolding chaperone